MQNVGFLYSIMPCLKEIYGTDETRLKNAAIRHFDFFNTHPYIANAIIALTLVLENEKVADEEIKSQQIKSLKLHLGGPLAAIGDTFFWSRLRPLCGLIAAGYLFISGFDGISFVNYPPTISGQIFLIPFMFIFLYNIPHIFFRFLGFWMGLKYKTDIVKIIGNFKFRKISEIIRITGIFICIFVLTVYLLSLLRYQFIGVAVFLVSIILIRRNISVIFVFWGLVIGCVGIGFLM